jgi:hypothetical protein
MRSFLRVMLLSLAVGPIAPSVAVCQDFDDDVVGFDELPPLKPPTTTPERTPPRTVRDSPILQGALAIGLAVAIPVGVFTIVSQMRQWKKDQERVKPPWEVAMEEAERKRAR